MILRHSFPTAPAFEGTAPRAAFVVFLEAQKNAADAVVPQIAHSALTGELAAHLLPEVFGELPPDVLEAAGRHDFGWAESDNRQFARVPAERLRPFPDIPEDEVTSWSRSLELADGLSPLTRVLISRHFSALANPPSPRHSAFLDRETPRRLELESSLGYSEEDLRRWAGAVGFCDLLSLYLCSGVTEPAWFPLAHPASREAKGAPRVSVLWREGDPVVSDRIFRSPAQVQVMALHFNAAGTVEALPVAWKLKCA